MSRHLTVVSKPCDGFAGFCDNQDAKPRTSRTQYCHEELNVKPVLCDECAEAYTDHWDEMWADYYRGCL